MFKDPTTELMHELLDLTASERGLGPDESPGLALASDCCCITVSDARLKRGVQPIGEALDRLRRINA